MSNILRDHNLINNHDGLDYEDGYTIEITSSPADTTLFKRDECCNWYLNDSRGQHTETLTIINDWLWHGDYYQKKYFSLLEDWNYKVQHGQTDSYEWILQHLFDYKHVMQTIHNTIAIDNLKNKSINGLSACTSTAGAINTINGALKVASTAFSFIPVFGQGISTVISLTSSACALANVYGRKRRDIFIVENKFDENIVKSINYEQHLSIDNKTNFVTNNITSL